MRFRACADCGRRVRGNYTRCYRCNARRRRSNWHDPQHLEGLEERDAELGRNQFFVYVLDTNYGHYVGHTANVGARLGAHRSDQVESTAGAEPELLWTSYPFSTRRDAAGFEAALKSLRDQRSPRFQEITGFEPLPFEPLYPRQEIRYPHRRGGYRSSNRGGGCGLFVLGLTIAMIAILILAVAIL